MDKQVKENNKNQAQNINQEQPQKKGWMDLLIN